jgi:hypothetical protein
MAASPDQRQVMPSSSQLPEVALRERGTDGARDSLAQPSLPCDSTSLQHEAGRAVYGYSFLAVLVARTLASHITAACRRPAARAYQARELHLGLGSP